MKIIILLVLNLKYLIVNKSIGKSNIFAPTISC